MATSGTTTFNLDIGDILDEAYVGGKAPRKKAAKKKTAKKKAAKKKASKKRK